MTQHVKVVAILSIVCGGLFAFIGVALFVVLAGAGAISGDQQAFFITGTIGTILGATFVLLGLPAVIGGIGLLKYRPWARIVIICVAILSLLHIPIGTAYGVYALYVLFNVETMPLFGYQAASGFPSQTQTM